MNGSTPTPEDFLFTHNGRELAIGWSMIDFSLGLSIKENNTWTWLDVVSGGNFDTMTQKQICDWLVNVYSRFTAKLKMFFGDTGAPEPGIPNLQGEQFLIWLIKNRTRQNGTTITVDSSGIV